MKELNKVLNVTPEHASQKDTSEKSPLHWLAQNEQRFCQKQNGAKSVVDELTKVQLDAIVELDNDNQMPFIAEIVSWTDQRRISIHVNLVEVKSLCVIQSGEYDSILVKYTLTPFIEWKFQMISTFMQTRDNDNHYHSVSLLDRKQSSQDV